jgi:hypothetical protein
MQVVDVFTFPSPDTTATIYASNGEGWRVLSVLPTY